MNNIKLQIPCSYQGGKQSLASKIVDILMNDDQINESTRFYDLCCGSGSISIELVNRGIKPKNIIMIDASPWGSFWQSIGNGNFDIHKFNELVNQIPRNPDEIYDHVKSLTENDAGINTEYIFILLQSSSFGGKQIHIEGDKWVHCGFRTYWLPTETSVRRSPSNPMSPMPDSLIERMEIIVEKMKGINAKCIDIEEFNEFEENSIIYIDPPYINSTGYKYDIDILKYIKRINKKCYVSEGERLSGVAFEIKGRKNSSITGNRKKKSNEEWLNVFNT